MPFALIIVAAIFIVTGFKGTTGNFLSTLGKDLAGFVVWIVAIGVIGAIGFIPGMKKISDGFLVLILLVMFISNKGFFAQFNSQIRANASPTNLPAGSSQLASIPSLNQDGESILQPNIQLGSSGQVQQQSLDTLGVLPAFGSLPGG